MAEQQEDFLLDEVWTLYFHDPKDAAWTTQSYVRVVDVSSAADHAAICHALRGRVPHGMFFLMREQVFPCWDDKRNIDGGCVSVRVPKHDAEAYWTELCARVLCEELEAKDKTDEEEEPLVNGVSISPKPFCSVVKVWLGKRASACASEEVVCSLLALPPGYVGTPIYRPNREVIGASQARALHGQGGGGGGG